MCWSGSRRERRCNIPRKFSPASSGTGDDDSVTSEVRDNPSTWASINSALSCASSTPASASVFVAEESKLAIVTTPPKRRPADGDGKELSGRTVPGLLNHGGTEGTEKDDWSGNTRRSARYWTGTADPTHRSVDTAFGRWESREYHERLVRANAVVGLRRIPALPTLPRLPKFLRERGAAACPSLSTRIAQSPGFTFQRAPVNFQPG